MGRSWSWVAGICQLLPDECGIPFTLVAPFGQGTSFRPGPGAEPPTILCLPAV